MKATIVFLIVLSARLVLAQQKSLYSPPADPLTGPPQMTLTGRVFQEGALGRQVLAGANVAVPLVGNTLRAQTATDGSFTLTVSDGGRPLPESLSVRATFLGHISQAFRLKATAHTTVYFYLPLRSPATDPAKRYAYTLRSARRETAFWPPPQCSALEPLSPHFFAKARTLADADTVLTTALNAATYPDRRYYYAPGGFVLITRIEQISASGRPLPGRARWSATVAGTALTSLGNYLRALFIPTVGHFRVIAFAVTNQPIYTSDAAPPEAAARAWLQQGADVLAPAVGALPFGAGYHCTALIYEFEQGEDGEGVLVSPGQLSAAEHLAASRIARALAAARP